MIKYTKQGEQFLINKIKAYFKTPKNVLIQDCAYRDYDKDQVRLLEFPTLNHLFGFNHKIYVCQDQRVDFNTLIHYDKFIKSELYFEYFIAGEGLAQKPNQYVMALVLKKFIWMISRWKDGYKGRGGVSINSGTDGFVMEPIDNFLLDRYGNLPDVVEYPLPS